MISTPTFALKFSLLLPVELAGRWLDKQQGLARSSICLFPLPPSAGNPGYKEDITFQSGEREKEL